MKLVKKVKYGFLRKNFLYHVIFHQILMLFKFLEICYISLAYHQLYCVNIWRRAFCFTNSKSIPILLHQFQYIKRQSCLSNGKHDIIGINVANRRMIIMNSNIDSQAISKPDINFS